MEAALCLILLVSQPPAAPSAAAPVPAAQVVPDLVPGDLESAADTLVLVGRPDEAMQQHALRHAPFSMDRLERERNGDQGYLLCVRHDRERIVLGLQVWRSYKGRRCSVGSYMPTDWGDRPTPQFGHLILE